MTESKILVVEDDPAIADLVALHLRDAGFEVEGEGDGRRAAERLEGDGFDLVVLDLGLPGVDGLEICRRLRADRPDLPVLILTARGGEADRVLGLEIGADDYLAKPFSVRELVARVRALIRRVETLRGSDGGDEQVRVGDLEIDSGAREVRIGGEAVDLTAREFDLLLHLCRHANRAFSRSQLLDQVWGYSFSGYEHTVNTHINRLRRKIEPDPSQPTRVVTVWGVGYKVVDERERS